MMETDMPAAAEAGACSEEELSEALTLVGQDDEAGLRRLDELIVSYAEDPRLHFLKGSVLAGLKRYGEAHQSMAHAVELAPHYDIARFQLGLLELSSGNAEAADATLQPLEGLDEANPLAHFGHGLRLLMRDELAAAKQSLAQGIALNQQYVALNRDMQLLISEIDAKCAGDAGGQPTTATQAFLQQFAARGPKN